MSKVIFIVLSIFLVACTNDSEDAFFSESNFDCQWSQTDFSLFLPNEKCVTENLSFETNILPIIDSKCNSCHGNNTNTTGVNLTNYNNFLSYDVCSQIDYNLMPPPSLPAQFQLTECEKLQIKTWAENGAIE